MFTTVNVIFGLSRDGRVAEEILENIGDNVKAVTIHTYSGEDHHLDCDDSVIETAKEVSYDTHEEDVFKKGITKCYSLDNDRNLENCRMVKLKGVYFNVVNSEGFILLNNETTNEVEYKCRKCEFKDLLESVDESYEVYKKEYSTL